MNNVTWKKRTLLGIMSASLLLGGVYTATGGNESQVGQEVSAAQSVKFASTKFKTTDNLNMRTGAGIGNRLILTIPRGTEVTSDTKIGIWHKVSYKGKTGYVSGKYLTKVSTQKSAPAPKATSGKTYQTTDNLNMRTGGSVKHKRILTIPRGGKVEYISKSGSWFKVKYNGKTGFVSSKYLKSSTSPVAKAPVKSTPKVTPLPQVVEKQYQTTDNLNMRTGASVKYKRILTIPRGGKVNFVSKSGSWYKVEYNGKTGYVSSKYLKNVSASTPAPKASPKPEVKQNLMSRAQAEAHISKYVNKSANGYNLMSNSGRYSIIVEFPVSNSGKAQMSVDGVNYISGNTITVEAFGQEEYDATKAHLALMNNAITAFAETQFGVGSKDSNTLVAEIKKMTLHGNNGDVKKITLQGKTVTIVMEGVRTGVRY